MKQTSHSCARTGAARAGAADVDDNNDDGDDGDYQGAAERDAAAAAAAAPGHEDLRALLAELGINVSADVPSQYSNVLALARMGRLTCVLRACALEGGGCGGVHRFLFVAPG